MPLDLVVTDLIAPDDAPAALREVRLPEVERWLARSRVEREPARHSHGWVAQAFGLSEPLPVAALTLAADDRPRPGEWLRADPVHLAIEGDGVVMRPPQDLELGEDEARRLAEALRAHFARDGLELIAPAADRWYLRVPEGESPATTPLPEAAGRSVFGLLPRSRSTFNWRSAITEAQMILSEHEVNAEREARGKRAVNSVWFWGEGAAPSDVRCAYVAVHSDDPVVRGLAAWAGVPVHAVPESIDRLPGPAAADSVLVVLDRLSDALIRGDTDSWLRAAGELDRDWFAGLSRAVSRFGLVRLVLPGPRADLVATRDAKAPRRWLRRSKPLAAYA